MPIYIFISGGNILLPSSTLLAVTLEDTETFDGQVYSVSPGNKRHAVIAEHDKSLVFSNKFHIRSEDGSDVEVRCEAATRSSDGKTAAALIMLPVVKNSTPKNIEIFNSDGTLGATLAVSHGSFNVDGTGFVVVWDTDGNVLWADQSVRRISGTGAGTPSFLSNSIAFTPDGQDVIFTTRISWNSNISQNHSYTSLPTINGSSFPSTYGLGEDIIMLLIRANATTGVIHSQERIANTDDTTNSYIVTYDNLPGTAGFTPSGLIPYSVLCGASGYTSSRTHSMRGKDGPTTNEPRLYEALNDTGSMLMIDPDTFSSRWALTIYYNSGDVPSRSSNARSRDPVSIPLSDNGAIYGTYEFTNNASNTNRGFVIGRDLNTTGNPNPSEQLLCRTRRWGGGHGGQNSTIIRLRDNPSNPVDPEIIWAESYGAGTNGGHDQSYANNNLVSMATDEANNRLFAVFTAKTVQWWTGSRYINPVSVYGVGANDGSLVIACLDLADGREIWTTTIQTDGIIKRTLAKPSFSEDRAELWVQMYFEEEAIFDSGKASEQKLTAVGSRRNGYAVYDVDTGEFIRWEEINESTLTSIRTLENNISQVQNNFPTPPIVPAPDFFYFSFDTEDKESIDVYTDLTGNSRHASWVGAPSSPHNRENEGGKIGESINLEASADNYLTIANTSTTLPLDQWTFSFWIRNENDPSSPTDYPIISKSNLTTDKEMEIGLRRTSTSATDVYVKLSTDGSSDIRLDWTSPTTSELKRLFEGYTLQHLAVTYHATEGIRIFYNGVEVASDPTAYGSLNRSSYGLNIARDNVFRDQFTPAPLLKADGDEFSSWTTRLTPTQIAGVYEHGRLGHKLL